MLPGGQINPDKLRLEPGAVQFVRAFFEAGKPVGAICATARWLLVEADVARGRTLTSYASIKTDLKNAGANWVDREVVVDQGWSPAATRAISTRSAASSSRSSPKARTGAAAAAPDALPAALFDQRRRRATSASISASV